MHEETEQTGTDQRCDVCNKDCGNVFIDGRTLIGPWANMCETCHAANGGKLGLGIGQKYERVTVQSLAGSPMQAWKKVAG